MGASSLFGRVYLAATVVATSMPLTSSSSPVLIVADTTEMYAPEVPQLARISPRGVVKRVVPRTLFRQAPYPATEAEQVVDTLRALIYDARESEARKRHAVIGAVTGAVVGSGLALLLTNGCSRMTSLLLALPASFSSSKYRPSLALLWDPLADTSGQ